MTTTRSGVAGALALVATAVGSSSLASQSCAAAATAATSASTTRPSGSPGTTGSIFVSHGRGGRVSVLTLETGAITTLDTGTRTPHEVAVSPDGRWAVAADFGEHTGAYGFDGRHLAVIDLATKRVARVIDLGPHRGPHDVMFLPGSSKRVVVTTQTTRNVVEVDVETGQVIASTPTGGEGSHTLAVAADGRTAFTANQPEGSVSRLDLSAHTLVRKFNVGSDPAEGIVVTPDGREVWVAFRGERVVRVIDGNNGTVLATLQGFPSTERLAITSDGKRVLLTDLRCREVKVADAATHRVIGSVSDLRDAAQVRVLPDNRTAIVPLLAEGVVAIVDIEERRVLARHRFGQRIDGAGWGPPPTASR